MPFLLLFFSFYFCFLKVWRREFAILNFFRRVLRPPFPFVFNFLKKKIMKRDDLIFLEIVEGREFFFFSFFIYFLFFLFVFFSSSSYSSYYSKDLGREHSIS